MRHLMKLLSVAAVLVLAASLATAGTLQTNSKDRIEKDAYIGMDRGLLDCSGAVELADGVTAYGTNVGAVNNVSMYGCSTWSETGGEAVYHIFLDGWYDWSMVINMNGCDLDIAVLNMCDEDLGCIGVVDGSVNGINGWTGDIYFVVDGYSGAACDFDITVTLTPYTPPEPVAFCDLVQDVEGVGIFSGDTCDGANLIEEMTCQTYAEAGLEDYYEIFMPTGSSFTVDLVHSVDSALWVLDACAEPFACLATADDVYPGGEESVSYTNTGADTVVYLVVDSYGTDSCGAYEFTFTPTGGAVANEVMSFGGVKALFK